jgi:hypothetical protein
VGLGSYAEGMRRVQKALAGTRLMTLRGGQILNRRNGRNSSTTALAIAIAIIFVTAFITFEMMLNRDRPEVGRRAAAQHNTTPTQQRRP